MSIFSILHRIGRLSKGSVFLQRLRSKFDSVHQEYNLVSILGICNQLCGFKAGHGLAAAGRMPDIAAKLMLSVPLQLRHSVRDLACRIILIAAHDLQYTVRIIGNRIETNQLMRHRDGKQ